jgi:hypothetical protein
MRLHWLTLRFTGSMQEDGFQRHRAARLQQADAWCLVAVLLGLLLLLLYMQLPLAATEGALVCSSETAEHSSSSFADSGSVLAGACSTEQQQAVQPVLLQQQLSMACMSATVACGLACMALLLLRQLRPAWYMQHRTAALRVCAVLAAAVSLCSQAAVLQAGISSSSSSSSSTSCVMQALSVLLFVVYAMPFAWALPAVAAYCMASAVLLQTAAVAAVPAQHFPQLLLACVLALACLYLWERRARLVYYTAAAAASCEGSDGCCNGNGCETADRTPSVSQQQQQHNDGEQLPQPPQQLQQQQQQQPGMAVLAPVTLPARSGAVPVPAALGYSSVFQRSVLAIKVQAPRTGEPAIAFGFPKLCFPKL